LELFFSFFFEKYFKKIFQKNSKKKSKNLIPKKVLKIWDPLLEALILEQFNFFPIGPVVL
jgi:hypothetical protein